MIGYIPKLYPDELVYSFLSRLAVHNGYMIYRQAAEDIFGNKLVNPSIEFIDLMLPEVKEGLTADKDMKTIILDHTMFSYYAEFLDAEKKREALSYLVEGNKCYYKKLPLPKWKEARFLRYCPLCAKEDQRTFGETYWHRIHQMSGINVCSKHGCLLYNSEVQITSDKTPEFVAAQVVIDAERLPQSGSEMKVMLAKYTELVVKNAAVFPTESIAAFLNNKLTGTAYLSRRGAVRKLTELSRDFVEYYQGTGGLQAQDTYRTRLEKILNGKRFHFLEICQLSMFLKISPLDLSERRSSDGTSSENYAKHFDKKVSELLKNGIAINEVARQLSISSKTVRDIRDKKFITDKKSVRGIGGRKRKDWEKVDEAMLPVVRSVLKDMKEKTGERPVRITFYGIAKKMNLPEKYFINMPMCRNEIKRYEVSFEEYWAREIEWGMLRIQKENLELNWKQLRCFTNLNRKNFQRCLPFIKDEKVVKICKDL